MVTCLHPDSKMGEESEVTWGFDDPIFIIGAADISVDSSHKKRLF